MDTKILPLDYNEQNYQKYNSQIQKYFSLFPPNNEALLENGNTLVVRYKHSNDAKWQYEKFPLYWRELTTINLKNTDYIVIRTGKIGFAQNKTKLSIVEYTKDDLVNGFVQTKIIKNTKSKTKIIGYEYVPNEIIEGSTKWYPSTLKHIIFLDIDKKNNTQAQFIYAPDKTIQCYQIGNVIYSNKHNDNIVIFNDLEIGNDDNLLKTSAKTIKKVANTTFAMFLWMIKGDN